MMVLPLTLAATVVSAALPPPEEHAAKAKVIRPTSARRVNCFESLRTWFSSLRDFEKLFCSSCGLGYLAALDASGAHAHSTSAALWKLHAHQLQIRIKPPGGPVVCVRYVIAKLRSFAAGLTFLSHDDNLR